MASDTIPDAPPFHVVFLLFDDVTQLDFTGPAQFLARLPGAVMHIAASSLEPISTDSGFTINPTVTLADCPQADLVCVPGGFGTAAVMQDRDALDFLRRQAASARYVTSVCTGSLALGAAGLLQGKKATTHWAYASLLEKFGAAHVDERVVQDGNLFTAGGVTSGIDFGLAIIAEIAGRQFAQSVQLGLEYDPAPPFGSGSPAVADPQLVKALRERLYDDRLAQMEAAIAASETTSG